MGRLWKASLVREGPEVLDNAARYLAREFDPVHGGFGPAPKFPQPVTLEFLLTLLRQNW